MLPRMWPIGTSLAEALRRVLIILRGSAGDTHRQTWMALADSPDDGLHVDRSRLIEQDESNLTIHVDDPCDLTAQTSENSEADQSDATLFR
jgi:hypothetical protein